MLPCDVHIHFPPLLNSLRLIKPPDVLEVAANRVVATTCSLPITNGKRAP